MRYVVCLFVILGFGIVPERPASAADDDLAERARVLVGADQGVHVETADGTVLVSQAADLPVHPASVTKVATTLALLRVLGPAHRFRTRIVAGGPVRDGRIAGDLVVEAGGDPFLVYESAFRMLDRLRTLGVAAVGGRLVVDGDLLFNWKPDPTGTRLARTLAGLDGGAAWPNAGVAGALAGAALTFGDEATVGDGPPSTGPRVPLVDHASPSLVRIVKALNGYSNNVFHFLADRVGGPPAVERVARAVLPPAWRDEVRIDNGAGGGATNRLSPRAVVHILRALEAEAGRHGLALTDLLPVAGRDTGTLRDRLRDRPDRAALVGKTGTFGGVGASALAGVLRTRRHGHVAFAILNHGVAVPDARARQDAFVRVLLDATDAEPWPYATIPVPTAVDAIMPTDGAPVQGATSSPAFGVSP